MTRLLHGFFVEPCRFFVIQDRKAGAELSLPGFRQEIAFALSKSALAASSTGFSRTTDGAESESHEDDTGGRYEYVERANHGNNHAPKRNLLLCIKIRGSAASFPGGIAAGVCSFERLCDAIQVCLYARRGRILRYRVPLLLIFFWGNGSPIWRGRQ